MNSGPQLLRRNTALFLAALAGIAAAYGFYVLGIGAFLASAFAQNYIFTEELHGH